MDSKIQAEEKLYRAVKRSKPNWLDDNNKPTSAMYKDLEGNSVDRGAGRSLMDVIHFMKTVTFTNRLKGTVEINIFLNTSDERLGSLRALMLADKSIVVYLDEEMQWVHVT